MQIEDMTTTEIEKYLQERKARKPKLGGTVKLASEMEPGERGWVEVEYARKGEEGHEIVMFFGAAFAINGGLSIETNVPELRRRMTAAEAAEQLEVGQEVWFKGVVTAIDKHRNNDMPIKILTSKKNDDQEWYFADAEIEVDA